MNVEFLVNTGLGHEGRQLFIPASEFLKADKDGEEYNSFAFATEAFFNFYGMDRFINRAEYEIIKKQIRKGGAVIVTVGRGRIPRYDEPVVYVSNNNRLKLVDLAEANQEGE